MNLIRFFNPVVWTANAALLVYEAFALFNKAPSDTISSVVWRELAERPYIALVFGALTGHFCLQRGTGYSAWALLAGLAFGAFVWKRGM